MKVRKHLIWIPVFLVLVNCGGKSPSPGGAGEFVMEDGIKTRHNPAVPLYGEIELKLREAFRITANREPLQSFGRFEKDPGGNIYITDYDRGKILKFSPAGEFLLEFGGKGEGPGEFAYIRSFRVMKEGCAVWGRRKVAFFSRKGRLLEEQRIKRSYYPVTIISPQQFVVNYLEESGEGSEYTQERICALIDRDEEVVLEYYREPGMGSTVIQQQDFVMAFSSSAITRDVGFTYSSKGKELYFYHTHRYKIMVRDLQGNHRLAFTRPWENRKIGDQEAADIVGMFRNISPQQKDLISKNLPREMCVLSHLKALPGGYILVYALRGVEEYEINLFGPGGRFLYIVKFPKSFRLTATRYFDRRVAGILEEEQGDVYLEYEILNFDRLIGPEG